MPPKFSPAHILFLHISHTLQIPIPLLNNAVVLCKLYISDKYLSVVLVQDQCSYGMNENHSNKLILWKHKVRGACLYIDSLKMARLTVLIAIFSIKCSDKVNPPQFSLFFFTLSSLILIRKCSQCPSKAQNILKNVIRIWLEISDKKVIIKVCKKLTECPKNITFLKNLAKL